MKIHNVDHPAEIRVIGHTKVEKMNTGTLKLDLSEVNPKSCRTQLLDALPNLDFPVEIIQDFWTRFSREGNVERQPTLVLSDLHQLAEHMNRFDSDFWHFRIIMEKPFFLAFIRDKRDQNVADLIDDIVAISNNRVSVINTPCNLTEPGEKEKLHSELKRIVNRYFRPDALFRVSYHKIDQSFLIEFNDGTFGEVTLGDLDILDMQERLILDSPFISEQGNAMEIFTEDGDIFDIDALLLYSMVSSETSARVAKESRLTADNVGKVIRSTRHRNSMTQQELANITKIDQAIISKIETGKHLPRFDTISRLAEGFNISVSDLLGTL